MPHRPGTSSECWQPRPILCGQAWVTLKGHLLPFCSRTTLKHPPGLLNHLIRPLQERRRERQAEGLGGLEIDDEFELGRLLDGKVAGLGTLDDSIHVERSTSRNGG